MKKINISIDDVSPHPNSSIKILENCYKLINEFPAIKITLFIPLAYWRTIGNTKTKEPLNIHKYKNFCNIIKNLNKKNFEIGFHGYYHGIPNKSNNDEFRLLSEIDTNKKIKLMNEELEKCGLNETFKKLFRPPAWRISSDAIKVFKKNNFKLCLSKNPSPITNEKFYDFDIDINDVNFSNIFPPFIPLKEFDNEDLNIVYHACEWDKNYLSDVYTNDLIDFLKNIENKEFVFM